MPENADNTVEQSVKIEPPDWKWPIGRPSYTWLHVIEADLCPLNFGLATAWRKATTRDDDDILWTQQRCSPVGYKRKKERKKTTERLAKAEVYATAMSEEQWKCGRMLVTPACLCGNTVEHLLLTEWWIVSDTSLSVWKHSRAPAVNRVMSC